MTLLLPATASVGRWNLDSVYNVDALALLAGLPDASVDAFILDLPYGTTACSWDEIIPFEPMWAGVKRVLKPRGVFVTTASQPFTSKLVMSNLDWFKYCWVWVKSVATGFNHASNMPMKNYEDIAVFSSGGIQHAHLTANRMNYYPQGLVQLGVMNKRKSKGFNGTMERKSQSNIYVTEHTGYPRMTLYFDNDGNTVHPTQKPVALFRYLIRTYTQPGDLVVDFCCGSGTTALAAREEGRRFLVGDTSPDYVAIARNRLAQPYTPSFMNLLDAADSATADGAETRVA